MINARPHRARRAGAALALLLAAGCTSTGHRDAPEPEKPTLDRIRESLAEGQRSNAEAETPADVQQALMPDVESPLPAEMEETRFDLAVDEAPARAFFMGLVDGTPYNMVVHPDVEGAVSLELKDVTVPDVMEIVRRVYGYEFERRSNGYIVLPARMQSRIFYVDYLNIDRRGESNMRVSSGQVTETTGGGDDEDGGGNAQQRRGNPGSRIQTESRADFWGNLQQTVRSIVGSGDGRSVVVDPQAGLVVVRGMPAELRDVGQYLQAAQKNLQRQVILEAKILEVRLSESHEAGVNWAALAQGDNGDAAVVGQTQLSQGDSTVLTDTGAFDPESITSPGGTSGFDFGGLFAIGARTTDFAALIRLLDTQGDVQVLSSPRVSTVNNQKAVIKVGSDEFFVTDVESDQDTSATTTSRSIDVELTPFFSGIALDVTPQVGRDGDVTLHVHPTVSEVTDQTKSFTVGGQTQTLPLAFSQVRESDSVVRARDGQVIVIGGLMQDQSTRRRAKSGGLGDLPLIGALFRQSADSSRRSELVILLRPIIADSGRDWSRQMEDMSRRLRERAAEDPAPGEPGGAGEEAR
jgi:MSHA biogenesis protein MshL